MKRLKKIELEFLVKTLEEEEKIFLLRKLIDSFDCVTVNVCDTHDIDGKDVELDDEVSNSCLIIK